MGTVKVTNWSSGVHTFRPLRAYTVACMTLYVRLCFPCTVLPGSPFPGHMPCLYVSGHRAVCIVGSFYRYEIVE